LFHQPFAARKGGNSATELAAYSRLDRKKEMAARRFFQPVENGFFHQRVQIESVEEQLLSGIDKGLLNDYFFTFWDFPHNLNKTSAMLLVLLLPHAHDIVGNLELMQDCLEILLQENVQVSLVSPGIQTAPGSDSILGMGALGNDFICGQTFEEDYPCLQYDIGPLQNSKPAEYVAGGENEVLLQVFNNYFAPAEADVVVHVEVDREKALVELNAAESPILGYATI
jgi:hypothetical protein